MSNLTSTRNISIARLWRDLREALRGSQQDFTSGSMGRAIFLLAVPMVLEMLMQAVFEVADIFFVGRLGADAVAAVGLSASLIILVFAIGMGLSMAAAAMVARRVGEQDAAGATTAAFQAILACILISIPIGIIGIVFAPDLLTLMGATEEVVAVGRGYCAVLFGGNITILLLFLINAIFRGAGDAALAMRALWIANTLNIVLDPLLIFGIGPFPEMGVTGAAVATTIGRGVGVLYQIHILLGGRARIRLDRSSMVADFEVMRRLIRVSMPGMIQFLVGTASWIGIMRIVALFGSAAVAGYTIAIRVIIFALLPSWGMGNAAATLVGQNLGAEKPERAERSVWISCFVNMVFLLLLGLVIIFQGEAIVLLFTTDAEVVQHAISCLKIVGYSFPLWAYGMVTVQAFNGAGDTVTPTWINLFSYWVFQIPLAYLLSRPFGLGADGVFIAISIAQVVLAIVGVLIFRRGRWKQQLI